MTLRWTVRNEGLGATVADKWYDRVWFSADDTLDGNGGKDDDLPAIIWLHTAPLHLKSLR